jgi:hypothetical protein
VEEDVRGVGVDRLKLVELIEEQAARLSPAGQELWLRFEQLVETAQPGDDIETMDAAIVERLRSTLDLPAVDQVIWTVLLELVFGLRASDYGEDRWGAEWGPEFRTATVIKAAQEKARAERRPVVPDTLDDAMALLAQKPTNDGG